MSEPTPAIIEIECGDIPELNDERRESKAEIEKAALEQLERHIPFEIGVEHRQLFEEFEAGETLEARFAQAIDKLEPMIHQLDHKPDWRRYGYTEPVLWELKGRLMEPFPELRRFYSELIAYLKREGYID